MMDVEETVGGKLILSEFSILDRRLEGMNGLLRFWRNILSLMTLRLRFADGNKKKLMERRPTRVEDIQEKYDCEQTRGYRERLKEMAEKKSSMITASTKPSVSNSNPQLPNEVAGVGRDAAASSEVIGESKMELEGSDVLDFGDDDGNAWNALTSTINNVAEIAHEAASTLVSKSKVRSCFLSSGRTGSVTALAVGKEAMHVIAEKSKSAAQVMVQKSMEATIKLQELDLVANVKESTAKGLSALSEFVQSSMVEESKLVVATNDASAMPEAERVDATSEAVEGASESRGDAVSNNECAKG